VNFVGLPARRGEMLRRSAELLRPGGHLFLVLPRACVVNSRCLDETRLLRILALLRVQLVEAKHSSKLAFYMLQRRREQHGDLSAVIMPREALGAGGAGCNNFAITLERRAQTVQLH